MLLLLFLFILHVPFSVFASGHHASHKRDSDRSSHDELSEDDARKLLASGQAAIAHANHAIIINPLPNRLEVLNYSELSKAKQVTGQRDFDGYRIHTETTVGIDDFSEACQNALTALVRCDDTTSEWTRAEYHGILPDDVDVDSICDAGCAESISDWLSAVDTYCVDSKWHNGAAPGIMGSFISHGINETCQIDKKTGKYCNGK